MISKELMTELLQKAMPDARVSITDRTGTMDHFSIEVISSAFNGVSLMDRQRIIYKALAEPMRDGRIHALEIKTQTPG